MTKIATDVDCPILFRTTNADVFNATLKTGSVWLRSDCYYREIEDQVRKDGSEGINCAKFTLPLQFDLPNGSFLHIEGDGSIGQQIIPHYIVSMHGPSISAEQLRSFGERTFGVRNIAKLAAETLYRCSNIIRCHGYRYGPVYYQYAALSRTLAQKGSAAIQISSNPPVYLNPINTDVLRKLPIKPFVEQDEWRIVIFTDGYLSDDSQLPLRINVDSSHFFAYRQEESAG